VIALVITPAEYFYVRLRRIEIGGAAQSGSEGHNSLCYYLGNAGMTSCVANISGWSHAFARHDRRSPNCRQGDKISYSDAVMS
jgi:hypothetical protein